jgi:hypothetical protein
METDRSSSMRLWSLGLASMVVVVRRASEQAVPGLPPPPAEFGNSILVQYLKHSETYGDAWDIL